MKIKPLEWREQFAANDLTKVEYVAEIRDFFVRFYLSDDGIHFFTWTVGEWDGYFDTRSDHIREEMTVDQMKAFCQNEYETWLKAAYGIED